MSVDELIAINGLLIERETELAGVSAMEHQVTKILGQPYPFDDLSASLPSKRKSKAIRGAKRPKLKAPPKARRLRANESAYRVYSLQNGKAVIDEISDFRPFEHLLQNPLPSLQITKVETLDANRSTAEILFER